MLPYSIISTFILATFIPLAHAQHASYTIDLPPKKTDWEQGLIIPRFNANSGTLLSVTFHVSVKISGNLNLENVDPDTDTVTSTVTTQFTLRRPSGSILFAATPTVTESDTLTAFDGVSDFGGTSGISHAINTESSGSVLLSPLSADDVTLFQGPGNVAMPVSVDGHATFDGGGNLNTASVLFAEPIVTITYDYAPPDLTITKTANGAGVAGQNEGFILTVKNVGSGPTLAPVSVTDVLPAGMIFIDVRGSGWSCVPAQPVVTCTRPDILLPGANFPPIIVTTATDARVLPSVANTATVSTPSDHDDNHGANADSLTIPFVAPTSVLSGGGGGGGGSVQSASSTSSAASDIAANQGAFGGLASDTGTLMDSQGCALPKQYTDPFVPGDTCFQYVPDRPITFSDDASTPQRPEIETLKDTKIRASGDFIVSGVGNHSTGKQQKEFQSGTFPFEPSRFSTRLEVVKMALVSNCIPVEDEPFDTGVTFTDIPKKHSTDLAEDFTARVFYTAAKHGIVSGYADGSAKPQQTATAGETLALLLRAGQVMPKGFLLHTSSDWLYPYVEVAKANHLVSEDFSPSTLLNRGNLAALVIHSMSLSSNPAVSAYVAQLVVPEQRFTPLEWAYAPVVQTGKLVADTNLSCEERSPRINACLGYDASRPLSFSDAPASAISNRFITLFKNTYILSSGDFIFSGIGNHSTGKQQKQFQSGVWEFLPARAATRLEVVKTALVANCIPILDYIPHTDVTFKDVPAVRSSDELTDFTARVFYTAALHGIITGYPDGAVRPQQQATLLETLTILLRTANALPAGYAPKAFSVPGLAFGSNWYSPLISFGLGNGIVTPAQMAHPQGTIRRDVLATMIAQIMRYSSDIQVRSYRDSVQALVE